ncbi:MAG: DUF1570 domain-containing protein [Phycisphaerae bacterium]
MIRGKFSVLSILLVGIVFFVPKAPMGVVHAGGLFRDDGPTPRKKKVRKKSSKKKGSKKRKSEPGRDKKGENKVRKALGEGFKIKRTPHYSIFYDTSDEDVKVFSTAIEKTFRWCEKFTRMLGMKPKKLKRKLITHFFNEFKDYADYSVKIGGPKPSPNMLGFYTPVTNHTYFYNFRNTPQFKKAREDAERKMASIGERMRGGGLSSDQRRQLQQEIKKARFTINRTNGLGGGTTEETLQHEVSHQVLYNIGFHNQRLGTKSRINPRWFAEGMAQLFEPISDGKAASFGLVNQNKARLFHNLAKVNRLIPLRKFIGSEVYFHQGDVGGLAYPQAWGLAHYLAKTKRKQVKVYADLIHDRKKDFESTPEKEIETFEKAFGKLDKRWERRWKQWMQKVN